MLSRYVTLRRWSCSAAVVALAATPFVMHPQAHRHAWLALPLVVAAVLMHLDDARAQMAWRAIVWFHACAVVIVVTTASQADLDRGTGSMSVWAAVALIGSLLVLGRSGLDDTKTSGAFTPKAFRASMTASIILALADSFVFLAPLVLAAHTLLRASPPVTGEGVALTAAALASGLILVAGAVGMYRLRVYGVLLALCGNGAMLAWLVGLHLLDGSIPPFIWALVVVNVAVQLGLQLPLLKALLTGARDSRLTDATLRWVVPAVLLGMLALCVAGGFISMRDTLRFMW